MFLWVRFREELTPGRRTPISKRSDFVADRLTQCGWGVAVLPGACRQEHLQRLRRPVPRSGVSGVSSCLAASCLLDSSLGSNVYMWDLENLETRAIFASFTSCIYSAFFFLRNTRRPIFTFCRFQTCGWPGWILRSFVPRHTP